MKGFYTILSGAVISNILLILILGNTSPAPLNKSAILLEELKTGDLVLRNGRGIISDWFRRTNLHDKKYSHAGLILREDNKIYVVHCFQDAEKPGLVKEGLTDFIDSRKSSTSAIYRYSLTQNERDNLALEIKSDLKSQIKFDDNFELGGSSYYCTEWIRKIVNASTNNSTFITTTSLKGYTFIAPENLYLMVPIKKIVQINS
jgi:hypothetical protein